MYFPKIIFHGKNSRFHSWFSDLINFQFGNSNLDGRPVTQKISKALIWTAVLGLLGLIFSCLIAIPLGVISAYYQGLKWDKWISWMSYIFYSIPLFWFATIMVVFFTTKELEIRVFLVKLGLIFHDLFCRFFV